MYCLNMSYSPELKCTFEVMQKIFLNLKGQRLSSKAQLLKKQAFGVSKLEKDRKVKQNALGVPYV